MKYSSLGRKMNTEVRLSYKKICVSVCAILFLFIYVFNKKSCISQPNQIAVSSSVEPIIYCITPTYNR